MPRKTEAEQSLIARGLELEDDNVDIQVVSQTDLGSVAADEKFMNEMVKVVIHPTTDPNASPYALLNVNGERVVVLRNTPTDIKRKHLEVLARLKETRWVQSVPDGFIGQIDQGSLRGHTGLVYPFSVLEDKNPKGGTWVANILAEPA